MLDRNVRRPSLERQEGLSPRIRGRFATNEEWEELKRQQAEKEKLGKKDTGPKVTAPKTLPVSKGKAKK